MLQHHFSNGREGHCPPIAQQSDGGFVGVGVLQLRLLDETFQRCG